MSLISMLHLDRILFGALLGLVLFGIAYPISLRKKPPKIRLYYGLLCIYIGVLIFLTMLFAPPWDWNVSQEASWMIVRDVNLNPFIYTAEIFKNCTAKGSYTEFIVLAGGNLALLAPLGILMPLISEKYSIGKLRILRIFGLSLLISVCIEALQLLWNILLGASLRTVEIDDVIFNVTGCVLTYLIFMLIKSIIKNKNKSKNKKQSAF